MLWLKKKSVGRYQGAFQASNPLEYINFLHGRGNAHLVWSRIDPGLPYGIPALFVLKQMKSDILANSINHISWNLNIGKRIEALFGLLIAYLHTVNGVNVDCVLLHFSTCLHNTVYKGSVKYSSYSLLRTAMYWPFQDYSGSECTILPFKSPKIAEKNFCYMVLV